MMFITKNIFVFLLSIITLCLLIIFFNYIGISEILNLIISSIIFSTFISLYFKEIKLCLCLFGLFFSAMLCISLSLDVIFMFLISVTVYFVIHTVRPKIKNIEFKNFKSIRMD